jgi:hypothetical protein
MIAKGFTPENGVKVFAIMKHPPRFHDREDFNTPWSSKSFAIMKIPPGKPGATGRGHQIPFAMVPTQQSHPALERLHNTRNGPRFFERHMR